MSERIIGNNEKCARRNGGVFVYGLIQLNLVIPVIFLPENLFSQHIISVNT